jgi:hypothetical protein
VSEEEPTGGHAAAAPAVPRPLKIFINYRRSDTAGDARALYDRLAARFGADNVFFDVVSLQPGSKWLDDIKRHGEASAVFIALIGPQWAEILTERARERTRDLEEDFVRMELEAALRRGSGVQVLPVLIGGAVMPSEVKLPGPLKPLARRQSVPLRHERFEDDLANLVKALELIAAGIETPGPTDASPGEGQAAETTAAQPLERAGTIPHARHFEEVVAWMVEEGSVVPFLGSGANASERGNGEEQAGGGYPPDARELARELATQLGRRLNISSELTDLAQVSQYMSVTAGPADLYLALRRFLRTDCSPTPVHRFLAQLPSTLQKLGHPERYQLIMTTNYDDALERAFDEAEEGYDLAVYMASGEHRGKFLHVPFDGEPRPILSPNEYMELPIGDDLEVQRTVIMKIHGGVESPTRRYPWKENYVITEDDYIDYLSQNPIEKLVPNQILDKLRYSHHLFLGYTMRDWHLRVFLQRVWGKGRLNRSWAIEPDPDILEKEFWDEFGVDLYASPLVDYVTGLGQNLAAQVATQQ